MGRLSASGLVAQLHELSARFQLEAVRYVEILRRTVFFKAKAGIDMRYATGVNRYQNLPRQFAELEGRTMLSWQTELIDACQHERLVAVKRRRGLGHRKLKKLIEGWTAGLP